MPGSRVSDPPAHSVKDTHSTGVSEKLSLQDRAYGLGVNGLFVHVCPLCEGSAFDYRKETLVLSSFLLLSVRLLAARYRQHDGQDRHGYHKNVEH